MKSNYNVDYRWCMLLLCAFSAGLATLPASAAFIVYNFRIAQITKPSRSAGDGPLHTLVGLIFDRYQKKYNGIEQNFAGELTSYIYSKENYYLRIDGAIAGALEKCANRVLLTTTDFDDVLLTGGHTLPISDRASFTTSVLIGIPTPKQFSRPLKSQFSVGAQIDGFYALSNRADLVWGARYLHFISRAIVDTDRTHYRFSIGNFVDLLIAYRKGWHGHGIEIGYSPGISFSGFIEPRVPLIEEKINNIRTTFYSAYQYRFSIRGRPTRFLCNVSYSFDRRKQFGNKYALLFWGALNIGF